MDATQLQHYRQLLEQELSDLRATSESHRQALESSHTTEDIAGGDRAAELEVMEVDTSVAESELNLAKKIQHALERISKGTYGLCEGCGQPIPQARLEAKPSVSLCIQCQEAHEGAV